MASTSKNPSTSINNADENDQADIAYRNSILLTGLPDEIRSRAESGILLQTMSTDNQSIPRFSADVQSVRIDDEQGAVLYYANHRLKEERLLLISNIFRLLLIFILAFLIYFQI